MKILWMALLAAALALLLSPAPARAAASYSDKYTLAAETSFQSRVRMALLTYCGSVINEDSRTVLMHSERLKRAVDIIGSPNAFAPLYANAAALDANVIGDATALGTVPLTSGNVATQATLVTDAHLDAAIAAQFNYFIVPL